LIRLGNVAEYHVENFGCRASRADGEMIGAELRHRGMNPALAPGRADVIVANTCSVTAQADRAARAFLRRMHRENPTARILVTGCYAQRAPQEVAALPGVHAVIGNSHKALVPEIAQQAAGFVPLAALYVDDAFAHSELSMPEGGWLTEGGGQTRPNLKVQDGCGNRCSFCIIPTTRGHSRSLSMEACLRNLPLQSGSDAILRAMHRRYRPWHYAEKLHQIRDIMPDAAIGADVMVGFPGESDALFEESFAFIAAQPFTYLHLFPFSARPGTSAWQLAQEAPVAPRAVAERLTRLRELIATRNLAFRQSFLGRELPAVTLHTQQGDLGRALTDNFLDVRLNAPLPANQRARVLVTGLAEDGLTGRLAA